MSGLNPDAVDIARELIPYRVRLGMYLALVAVGLALGAIGQWLTAVGTPLPTWMAGANAVATYLLVPFGLVAAVNVNRPTALPDTVEGLPDGSLS